MFRYVHFCIPAVALLVGAGLAAFGWRAGAAALAIIVELALPMLPQVRTAGGHGDDIRGADRIVAANVRPGDALLYLTFNEPIEMTYRYGLRHITNIVVGERRRIRPARSAARGPRCHWCDTASKSPRMWLVQLASSRYQTRRPPKILRYRGFREARTWHPTGVWLTLDVRVKGRCSSGREACSK